MIQADGDRLSSWLSVSQFRVVTSTSQTPEPLLQNCPTLLEEGATCQHVSTELSWFLCCDLKVILQVESTRFEAWYVPKIPSSSHVILYVHGGGFVSGSPETASPYLLQLAVELQERGTLVDCFAVRYGLAPEEPYPNGLRQVVAAYEHVRSLNKPIILMGDSAGGNLCLALLRHIQTPHPKIPALSPPKAGNGLIMASCLTSPWVNLRNDGASFGQNRGKDSLDKAALDRWREDYLAQKPVDLFSNPIDAVKGWRKLLPPRTFLIAGELDLFVADMLQLAKQITDVSECSDLLHSV